MRVRRSLTRMPGSASRSGSREGYRIIYRILDEKTVEVLTVYHSARLLALDLLLPE